MALLTVAVIVIDRIVGSILYLIVVIARLVFAPPVVIWVRLLIIIIIIIIIILLLILIIPIIWAVILINWPIRAVETIVNGLIVSRLIKRVILVNNNIIIALILYVLYFTVTQLILISVNNDIINLKIQEPVIIAEYHQCLDVACILLI